MSVPRRRRETSFSLFQIFVSERPPPSQHRKKITVKNIRRKKGNVRSSQKDMIQKTCSVKIYVDMKMIRFTFVFTSTSCRLSYSCSCHNYVHHTRIYVHQILLHIPHVLVYVHHVPVHVHHGRVYFLHVLYKKVKMKIYMDTYMDRYINMYKYLYMCVSVHDMNKNMKMNHFIGSKLRFLPNNSFITEELRILYL